MRKLLLSTVFALAMAAPALADTPDVITITPEASTTCTESASQVKAANPDATQVSADVAKSVLALFVAKLGEPPFPHDALSSAFYLVVTGKGTIITFINKDCTGFSATLSVKADPALYANVMALLEGK